MLQGGDVILIEMHGLLIASLLFLDLLAEAFRLIFRVVQLGKSIGDLPSADKELKAIGDVRVDIVTARQG